MQTPFGGFDHDSLQYHVFCGPIVGAARLFRTASLEHASLWLWRDGRLEEIAASRGPFETGGGVGLSLGADGLAFREDPDGIRIEAGDGALRIRLAPRRELRWSDTISEVVHQPDLDVTLLIDGAEHRGIGYCKRYSWTPAPRHWGYRFVQGYAGAPPTAFWTAEATFGLGKYDYFKALGPDGALREAAPAESCHRQDAAHARLGGEPVALELEELAVWEAPLVSGAMDSLLRQRVCRLTARIGGVAHDGFAINETCYGTLG